MGRGTPALHYLLKDKLIALESTSSYSWKTSLLSGMKRESLKQLAMSIIALMAATPQLAQELTID